MGNKTSHTPRRDVSKAASQQLVDAFDRISQGQQSISYDKFQEKFGKHISVGLWRHFQGDSNDKLELHRELFNQNGQALLMDSDVYIKIMMPVDLLLQACFEANNIEPEETGKDEQFIESLKKDMTSNGDTYESIVQWKNSVCPRLCQTLQDRVLDMFFGRSRPSGMIKSDILSAVQTYILCHCLPTTVYFPQLDSHSHCLEEDNINKQWTKLYSSVSQGISINRFEANCFNYKGSSVAIFKLTNGDIFAIATDQEWRHSVKKYGGPNCVLFQFHPKFKRIDSDPPAIYCNFKTRSSTPLGLNFGRHFSVDGDMANLFDMEVWGCGGNEALQEQQKQKQWLKRQAEKNSTVPLPGNWDDNPDKSIMEMHGFQFSSERKNDRPDDC